jgi:predicted DNA-binding transcriptional regulator AlpA/biotin operon repressor
VDRLLRLERVAELLDLSRDEARSMAEAGQLPTAVVLPNGQQRWRESDVERWMMDLECVSHEAVSPRVATVSPPQMATRGDRMATEWRQDGDTVATRGDTDPVSEPEDTRAIAYSRVIINVLKREKCWVSGPDLALKIGPDVDSHGGTFTRAVRMLKEAGQIESSQTHGYKIRSPDTS